MAVGFRWCSSLKSIFHISITVMCRSSHHSFCQLLLKPDISWLLIVALNDALREEVQRLKLATGQMMPSGGIMNFGQSSFGANQQFYHHNNQNQAMQSLLAAHQLQQLQIHSQHTQQLHPRQQQQSPADLRMRGTVPQSQRESAAVNSSASME